MKPLETKPCSQAKPLLPARAFHSILEHFLDLFRVAQNPTLTGFQQPANPPGQSPFERRIVPTRGVNIDPCRSRGLPAIAPRTILLRQDPPPSQTVVAPFSAALGTLPLPLAAGMRG